MNDLSRLEGQVLALIAKWQPTTAYFVRKSLEQMLASNVTSSPGAVYPAIARMKNAGLIAAHAVTTGLRDAEELNCTPAGLAAVKDWLTSLGEMDLLPDDPVRAKVHFADLLTRDELSTWLRSLQTRFADMTERLDAMAATCDGFAATVEIEHARLVNAARLAWVGQALETIAERV